ncbi:MAG: transcription elongation factor GreA [Patescibacteria group bacterium]|nr:transcription elongation factor GreA [Patescibacteria group bacterium]
MTKNYLSPEAYRKLQEELEMLKTVKRKEIALKIQEAKELGDLSENAAYQEAKDAQAALETRILDLELLLKNSTLIKPRKNSGIVEVGSQVTVQSLSLPKTKKQFLIIGAQEADPAQGKISNESPLGKAFLGRKKGETVVVKTPKGEVKYKILNVS